MNKLFLLFVLWLASAVAWASDASLRQCRALAEPTARLACYDNLPLPAVAAQPLPATAVSAGKPVVSAVVPAAVAAPVIASAGTTQAVASFGLETAGEKLQEIRSHIPGLFDGWRSGDRIRLANGQVWRVVDDSRADYYLRDPKVTVRRGSLGSFLLDIEGANQLPRVRRVE
jgi:hypothetical protein